MSLFFSSIYSLETLYTLEAVT